MLGSGASNAENVLRKNVRPSMHAAVPRAVSTACLVGLDPAGRFCGSERCPHLVGGCQANSALPSGAGGAKRKWEPVRPACRARRWFGQLQQGARFPPLCPSACQTFCVPHGVGPGMGILTPARGPWSRRWSWQGAKGKHGLLCGGLSVASSLSLRLTRLPTAPGVGGGQVGRHGDWPIGWGGGTRVWTGGQAHSTYALGHFLPRQRPLGSSPGKSWTSCGGSFSTTKRKFASITSCWRP